MIRQTSKQSFKEMNETGYLQKKEKQCHMLLLQYGEMTCNQVIEKAKIHFPELKHQGLESIARRLSDLVKKGVAQEAGKIKCPISGRTVILWKGLDNPPIKLEKPVKIKCEHCNGKGHIIEIQQRLF